MGADHRGAGPQAETKSARTRAHLLRTALQLFREQGYEATTMRRIAQAAEVSTGNAYYHFAGKDAFIQELYVRIQAEHRGAAAPRIVTGARLVENLRMVLHAGVDVMAPHHPLGTTLLRTALPAEAPASPFSTASRAPRAQAISLMAEVVQASKGTPAGGLGEKLPQLLWLAYLGITLFWVLDRSEGQTRTRTLIDGAAALIARALSLTRLPGGRALAEEAAALMDRLAPSGEEPAQ